ncbi:hypothetical protein [Thiothrix lacustris]|uniref:hypothetical protein n=1 Tax=Thiothrix lacustris TaxID=525917 RepID=UPI00048D34BD|nr:hypothetical protein [Thiothrix lacustris]WMP17974.1 hypothetical protein RCS87_02650 [Thiothrix lacustris]
MSIKVMMSVVGCVAFLSMSGCASVAVGNAPDKTPPKLMKSENARGLLQGKSAGVLWDKPSAFGPVPANLQTVGNAACQAIGFAKASGYHPSALDVEGKAIAGGGFFCSAGAKQ